MFVVGFAVIVVVAVVVVVVVVGNRGSCSAQSLRKI